MSATKKIRNIIVTHGTDNNGDDRKDNYLLAIFTFIDTHTAMLRSTANNFENNLEWHTFTFTLTSTCTHKYSVLWKFRAKEMWEKKGKEMGKRSEIKTGDKLASACVRCDRFCTSIDSIHDDGLSLKSTIKFQSNSKIIMWSGIRVATQSTGAACGIAANSHIWLLLLWVRQEEKRTGTIRIVDGKSIFNRIGSDSIECWLLMLLLLLHSLCTVDANPSTHNIGKTPLPIDILRTQLFVYLLLLFIRYFVDVVVVFAIWFLFSIA